MHVEDDDLYAEQVAAQQRRDCFLQFASRTGRIYRRRELIECLKPKPIVHSTGGSNVGWFDLDDTGTGGILAPLLGVVEDIGGLVEAASPVLGIAAQLGAFAPPPPRAAAPVALLPAPVAQFPAPVSTPFNPTGLPIFDPNAGTGGPGGTAGGFSNVGLQQTLLGGIVAGPEFADMFYATASGQPRARSILKKADWNGNDRYWIGGKTLPKKLIRDFLTRKPRRCRPR